MSAERRAETVTQEMTRYVRFRPEDGSQIAILHGYVVAKLPRIAESFYERIREHEEAHAVLRDEAQVKRLHGSMVRWLESLFSGIYDQAHFAATERVGWVHVKIGLPQRYMHTAMTLIRQELHEAIGAAAAEHHTACRALDKLIDLELAVMVEAFREHDRARLEQLAARPERGSPLAHFIEAIERARVLVVGTDDGFRIRLFNREAERATGWARDEAEKKPIVSLLFPEDHGTLIQQRLQSVAVEDDLFFDATLLTRSGPTRNVRWQIARAPSAPAGDEDVRFFFIGHDVTDEVALAERTRRAERLAAVGTLAAGLAHEIRNPLNGAHLHLTLLQRALKKGTIDHDAMESLNTVASEIQRLGNLVTDFLSFARPQALRLVPTGLGEVVQHAVSVLAPEAERRGVSLTMDLPRKNVGVAGDAARLEQVILNLVRNAIEANDQTQSEAPKPGGHVVVRLRRTPTTAVLEVEDDGPGLPSPEAPIFDAFYTTKASGTGLGLSIAHRIVEDHGGTMKVDSAPGRTVFRLVLPRAEGTFGDLS